MLIAELYEQSAHSRHEGHNHTDGRHEGLALAAEIIKKHREGLTSLQIVLSSTCLLYTSPSPRDRG